MADAAAGNEPPSVSDVAKVFFDRRELDQILWLYGRMVAAGEWRDYAIDALPGRVLFSIFRRASEQPLYQIEKRPALARKQGAWAIYGQHGQVLKRGHELGPALRVLEPKRVRAVGD
jgi:hypothetical protein